MNRLIDADEVLKTICKTTLVKWQKAIIWALVDMQKTVDAVPVRHAHWSVKEQPVWGENTTEPWYTCSECGYETNRSTPYCPMCGARMDAQ